MNKIIITVFSIFIFLYGNSLLHSQSDKDGVIKGEVLDYSSSEPIEGASVRIPELDLITSTNRNGYFIFKGLSMNSYQVVVTHPDYKTLYSTISLSDSNKYSYEKVFLEKHEYSTDTIKVKDFVSNKNNNTNVSFKYFDYDEMQKAPGASEDIIKFIQSTSGVSFSGDITNDLIVRGGSPIENLFLIDGFEIKNPNHYATPGSTNGVISYINLKLVEGVDFYTGAFPSIYGDKLSSVINIRFREGNRERHIQDLNISATGIGGVFEGPLNESSSYIFSVRRSYLELIKDQLNMAILPNYWDFNMKMNYDLNKNGKLSLVSFLAIDNADTIYSPDARSLSFSGIKKVDLLLFSSGLSYEKTLSSSVFRFDVAFAMQDYSIKYTGYDDFKLDIKESEFSGKIEYYKEFLGSLFIKGVLGFKYLMYDNDLYSSQSITPTGYYVPKLDNKYIIGTHKIFSGLNITQKYFNDRLNFNIGIRYDYFEYMDFSTTISPRFGLTFELTPVTSINAGYGIYYQTPEILWLASYPSNKSLKSMQAKHYIVGLKHLFSHDFVFDLELYHKDYKDYPVSVYDPYYIFINSGTSIYPNFLDKAVSEGKGYFEGVEVSFSKKSLGAGFFGRMNIGLTRSKFKALMGDYYPSEFDYGRQLTAIAGYEFLDGWQLGLSFKYTGGRPYTPIDVYQSTILSREYFDMSKYKAERLPEYVRLDIRVGKKFVFEKAMLNIYIEVLNLLNRDNVYYYEWSTYYRKVQVFKQLSIIPILGVSAVF